MHMLNTGTVHYCTEHFNLYIYKSGNPNVLMLEIRAC